MTDLKIVTAPNPILAIPSEKVEVVDQGVQALMAEMLDVMYQDSGIGLAAVQVGIHKQIIVIDLQEDDEDSDTGDHDVQYPLYLVNPEITYFSEEMNVATEGCLSVPQIRVDVPRPESIKIEYLDYHGKSQKMEVSGWLARVIQHEYDHLQGKLIIDYLSSLKKDFAIAKLKKFKKHLT